jgi:hypothetical protein
MLLEVNSLIRFEGNPLDAMLDFKLRGGADGSHYPESRLTPLPGLSSIALSARMSWSKLSGPFAKYSKNTG